MHGSRQGNKERRSKDKRLGDALPSRYRKQTYSKDPYDLSMNDEWSSQRNHEKRQEEQHRERVSRKERRAKRREDDWRRREEVVLESKLQASEKSSRERRSEKYDQDRPGEVS